MKITNTFAFAATTELVNAIMNNPKPSVTSHDELESLTFFFSKEDAEKVIDLAELFRSHQIAHNVAQDKYWNAEDRDERYPSEDVRMLHIMMEWHIDRDMALADLYEFVLINAEEC